jgi:hypothetical protein
LVDWANQKLAEHGNDIHISDLSNDLKTGVKLAHLINVLSGAPPGAGFNEQPTALWQFMQNATWALRTMEEFTLSRVTVCSERDIVLGVTSILLFLYILYIPW